MYKLVGLEKIEYIINFTAQSKVQNFSCWSEQNNLGSKCSNCHALASTMQGYNCASSVLWRVRDCTSLKHTRGLVRTDNQLTPTDWGYVSHLGEIKTPAAEKYNFKAQSLLETILCTAERISAGFSSVCAEHQTSAYMRLPTTAVPCCRDPAPQGTVRNVWKHVCVCHNLGRKCYWHPVGRGQGCCWAKCRIALKNKKSSSLKCQ